MLGLTLLVFAGIQEYFNTRPIMVQYYGEVGGDAQYFKLLTVLREAHYGQRVDIYMSSPGGSVIHGNDLAVAMQESHGTVVYHVGSFAASMAAVMLCSADKVDLSDNSVIMFHTIQGPEGAIINPEENSMDGTLLHAAKILTDKCKFLTKEEKESIWSGGEVWLNGDEINKRLGSQ